MLNYFNFSLFLTTLGIVSVSHVLCNPNNYDSPYSPMTQPRFAEDYRQGFTAYQRPSAIDPNLLKSFSNSDPNVFQRQKKQRPFSASEFNDIETQIRRLKGTDNNYRGSTSDNDRPKETILRCIDVSTGESRIMNEGEKCLGFLSVTTRYKQDRSQPLSTSESGTKSPFSYPNNLSSPLMNQNSFRSPSSNPNISNPLKSNQNRLGSLFGNDDIKSSFNEDSSKPSRLNKYTPNALNSASSLNSDKYNNNQEKTKDPTDYSHLERIFDSVNRMDTNDPNETTQEIQDNSPLPEGTKLVVRDGMQVLATLPEDKPAKARSYVEPLNLSFNEVNDIRKQVFKQANMYRRRHGCTELTLNDNINNHAQEWANELAESRVLKSRKVGENRLYGQTVYASKMMGDIGKVAVDTWYNELMYLKEGDKEEELHKNLKMSDMIQLLWKKSREIGIGVAKNNYNEHYYIVADYNPRGDVYPFLYENLPEFKKEDIDAAKKSYDMLEKIVPTKMMSEGQAIEPVPNSTDDSQQSTNGNPIGQSNDPYADIPKVKRLSIVSEQGIPQGAFLPLEVEPVPRPDVEPVGFSRKEVEEIRQDVLAKSNYYRKKYNFPPLVLDKKIDYYAQEWANTLATKNEFHHRFDDGLQSIYGENIHRSSRVLHVGELAVDMWYYEIGYLHVGDTDEEIFDNDDAGHATQLLWKYSQKMGVGAAIDRNGRVIIVANYNPKGNARYFYLENLPAFTQDQIDEAKRLQEVITTLKNSSRIKVAGAGIEKLPGWESKLHNN